MRLPLDTASSISRTELSRATASGMNEFGNSTVSRSGSTGNSLGRRNAGWSLDEASGTSSEAESSTLSFSLLIVPRAGPRGPDGQALEKRCLKFWGRIKGGRWPEATPERLWTPHGRRGVHERVRD